jgi:hypothetical protein
MTTLQLSQSGFRTKRQKSQYAIPVLFLILVFLLAGCAQAASPTLSLEGGKRAEQPAVGALPPVEQSAPGGFAADSNAYQAANQPQTQSQAIERLVIKNGTLSLVVDDPATAMDDISRLADELGGYVVTANLFKTVAQGDVEVPQGEITVRVPVERFTEALAKIEKESFKAPLSKNITSQDVTSEYTDLQSRLRNLEAAEAQLTLIMQDAKKTEDVLSVYTQLTQVREQIEVIKGQIKYYEQSAALSSIQTTLLANAAVQPLTIGGWQPVGVVKNAVQALINVLKGVASLVIWLLVFLLPVLIALFVIFGVPIWILIVLLNRRSRRRKAQAAPPTVVVETEQTPQAPDEPATPE